MRRLSVLFACLLASATFADLVKVGSGAYRRDLPPGADGKPRRQVEASPLLSERLTRPAPTSDWCSSLVWPMHSPHSQPMFPHPLAVQAHAEGLGIGYTRQPTVSHHEKDGKIFQRGTSYRYPYRESIVVGLKGMKAKETRLDAYSAWMVTALWQDGADELRATFGHGSPFVFFESDSDRPLHIRLTAAKVDRHREPVDPFVYEWRGITGAHLGKPGRIQLAVNAGKQVGIGSKARLVYDFDGDGKTDRIETFALFATDPVPASWERYSSEKQALDRGLTQGKGQHFENGSVRLEFWKCFGEGSVQLKLADSRVFLPLAEGERRFDGAEFATVGGSDKPPAAGLVTFRKGSVLGLRLNGRDRKSVV